MARTLDQWEKELGAAAPAFVREMRRVLVAAAGDTTAAAKLNATVGPKVRSGLLRSSIRSFVRRGPELVLQAGESGKVRYAAAQEYGAVIRPVRSRYLAIPLPAARTNTGVARYPGPRSVPGLFFIRSKAGNRLLVVKSAKGITPMFVLKDSVTIKKQPYLRPALDETAKSLRPALQAALATAVLP